MDNIPFAKEAPLSADEEQLWNHLVEEGTDLRAETVKRLSDPEWRKEHGRGGKKWVPERIDEIPVSVKRFIVSRAAGLSFKKAAAASGALWADVSRCRDLSETVRCALAAQEKSSRELMKMKAYSLHEQGLDEDAHVSMAQMQMASGVLGKLDRDHFGDDMGSRKRVGLADVEEAKKALGSGGFVINLIADASKAAEKAPEERPKKALVFAEV